MRFVDTNVLLYATSTAPDERVKKDAALAILDDDDLVLSVQVLQEFYVQATRPTRSEPLEHDQAVALIESWLRFRVEDMTSKVMRNALATTVRWKISYWDAAVVETAREAGCLTILSEDLQDDMDFGGVRVSNPFSRATAA
jgi:predicted nucleic acid-binding protein